MQSSPGPYNVILPAALSKTNRENKNVKYDIVAYTIDSFVSYFCLQTIYIETKKLTTITKLLTTIEKSKYLYVVVVDNLTSVKYICVHHITSTTMKMVGCNVYWHRLARQYYTPHPMTKNDRYMKIPLVLRINLFKEANPNGEFD